MNTLHHLTLYALDELKDLYDDNEISSICKLIYTDVFNYTNINIHLKKDEYLDKSFVNKFHDIIGLLKTGKPIQYILREVEFSGLKLKLNKDTLIPRPETEELILWVAELVPSDAQILDIGTGSGCIALSLAHLLPQAKISGIDIAEEAIDMATENARNNLLHATFMRRDILNHRDYTWEKYDCIVSNPPYVRDSEKQYMHVRVLEHEPHRALFVSDEDPLLFYRTIAEFGKIHLNPNGLIFFEINEALGQEMIELMHSYGYCDISLKKDIFEKDRFIKCRLGQD
ncbi:peptide chain release factor N(5)-glutamine methyltransferase [Odoribacter sp. OttesenSCG-928-J03]|nr:peptide chain release factor N(5)-glutamine methyltransferase [Odoribacter sp. OttesenSCG-928-J03]